MRGTVWTIPCKDRRLVVDRPLIMGIINLNSDSFSGDGTEDVVLAWKRAAELIAAGADILDVGAESARADRVAVDEGVEVARFRRFFDGYTDEVGSLVDRRAYADQVWPPILSTNTWRSAVVEEVLSLGAEMVNDMGGLPDDRNARLCAEHGASLLIMHTIGMPKERQTHRRWDDVIPAIEQFFEEKLALAEAAGMGREALVLDPGIDFAKSGADNLRIFKQADRFARFERPVLFPVSRKTIIGEVLDLPDPCTRDAGTLACLVACVRRAPACMIRVHNVAAAAASVRVMTAIQGRGC